MKKTIPEVLPLVEAYLAKEGNGAGGSLHLVLEDGNTDPRSIRFCIAEARKAGDTDGVELGETILGLSKTQRKKLAGSFSYPDIKRATSADYQVVRTLGRLSDPESQGPILQPGDKGWEEANYEVAFIAFTPEWTKRLVRIGRQRASRASPKRPPSNRQTDSRAITPKIK